MSKLNKCIGKLQINITSNNIENLLNMLWERNIDIKNLKKNTINSIEMEINVKDYETFLKCARKTNSKMDIIKRSGPYMKKIELRKRFSFVAGAIFFFLTLEAMKGYIWSVEITTEENVSPFQIRQFLKEHNVTAGLKKGQIDLSKIEEVLNMNHPEIVWSKARIYGSTLKIQVAEKKNIPDMVEDDYPSNFIARKDGEIIRVYTESGTSKVKAGQMVKKGDLLVEGIQGKEGSEYMVNSNGKVISKTFYEKVDTFNKKEKLRKRTGKLNEHIYFELLGKKIFLKNKLNNFKNYDRIVDNSYPLKKITYYEVVEEEKEIEDLESFIETVHNKFYKDITLNFNREMEVLEVIKDFKDTRDKVTVRLVVIAEENIAEEIKMDQDQIEKYKEKNHENE